MDPLLTTSSVDYFLVKAAKLDHISCLVTYKNIAAAQYCTLMYYPPNAFSYSATKTAPMTSAEHYSVLLYEMSKAMIQHYNSVL